MSDVPRMIEGGIRHDHRSIRARLAVEEFELRIRAVSPPELVERWLAIAEELVAAAYEHGTTTTTPNEAWVEDARRRVYEAITAGRHPDEFRSLRNVTPPEPRALPEP